MSRFSQASRPRRLAHSPAIDHWCVDCESGAVFHGLEIPYVFQHPIPLCKRTHDEQALSHLMGTLWTSFAKTGVPSSQWPKFGQQQLSVVFNNESAASDTPLALEQAYRNQSCVFWSDMYANIYWFLLLLFLIASWRWWVEQHLEGSYTRLSTNKQYLVSV